MYQAGGKNGDGDVLMKAGLALDSAKVLDLHYGDVVEQAAPSTIGESGIVRMQVIASASRRGKPREADDAVTQKITGWVTADASPAGGPVFFKLVPDADNPGGKSGQRVRPTGGGGGGKPQMMS